MSEINTAVLQGVSTTTVGTVLTGVVQLSDGLRSAAAGSTQIHDGTAQLATGADQLADGLTNQLAPGAADVAKGGTQLAAGASDVATGMTQLQGATDTLGDGAKQVANGLDELVATADVPGLQAQLAQLRTVLPASGAEPITEGLDQIAALLTGLQQLQAGSREVATQLTDPQAEYRAGVNGLVSGSSDLRTGAHELATGLDQLSAGTVASADGARQLQDGAHQLDTGATALADGLKEGAAQAPDLGDQSQQNTLAGLISTPVSSTSANTAPAQFDGPGGAPALLVIASALIPLLVLMSFRAHRYVTAGDPPRTTASAVRRFLIVTAVSIGAMAVVGPILWSMLTPTPHPASMVQVVLVSLAATVMNAAISSLLFSALGYVAGALTTLASMMLQVFAFGGVWMVETLPAPLRWLHPFAPMTYVRDGFIAGFNGVDGFALAIVITAAFTVGAWVINLGIYRAGRARYLHTELAHPAGQPVLA